MVRRHFFCRANGEDNFPVLERLAPYDAFPPFLLVVLFAFLTWFGVLFFLITYVRTSRYEGNVRECLSGEGHPPSGVFGLAYVHLHGHPAASKAGGYHGTPGCGQSGKALHTLNPKRVRYRNDAECAKT